MATVILAESLESPLEVCDTVEQRKKDNKKLGSGCRQLKGLKCSSQLPNGLPCSRGVARFEMRPGSCASHTVFMKMRLCLEL